jgi:hypothetical protein
MSLAHWILFFGFTLWVFLFGVFVGWMIDDYEDRKYGRKL